jgi:hypothetical protein
VTGWTLAFELPVSAKLGSSWDASVAVSGAVATATNKSYNATIPAGASSSFGFVVAGRGTPVSCTINGNPCGPAAPTTTPVRPRRPPGHPLFRG